MVITWFLAIIAICLSLIRIIFYFPSWRTYQMMKKLPGPKGLPLLGVGLELARVKVEDLLDYLKQLSELPGRVTSLWVSGLPVVIIWKPEDYEVVLKGTDNIKKGVEYKFLKQFLGNSILVLGEESRERRKIITPAFNFQILSQNLPVINKHSRVLIKRFLASAGQPILAAEYLLRCTFDISSEAATGNSMNTQSGGCDKYIDAIENFDLTALTRTRSVFYRTDWIFKLSSLYRENKTHLDYVHNLAAELVKRRLSDYKGGKTNPFKCYLDYLTNFYLQGENLTVIDMQNELQTFLLEGTHTVGSVMSFFLLLIGCHQEIQDQAYSEQLEIFGDDDRDPTVEDVRNMKYLDKCMKESLRMYPVGTYLTREVLYDITLRDGTVIPQGVNLVMSPFVLHRNSDIYPEPEKFDPERFNPDETLKRHPFAFIPFMAGPRNCIGQKYAKFKMKALMSTIIRHIKIESVTDRTTVKCIPAFAIGTNKPLYFRMTPR